MSRRLVPGRVDRHGVAHPIEIICCNGNCDQGDLCPHRLTEMSCSVPLRETLPTLQVTRADDQLRQRGLRRLLASALAAWLAFALLMWLGSLT